MVVVLFRSRLGTAAGADYEAMATEMETRARAMPGFVDVKTYRAADGERLTVARWESADAVRAWGDDVRHREAQRLGREQWYDWFQLEVAEVVRSSGSTRER